MREKIHSSWKLRRDVLDEPFTALLIRRDQASERMSPPVTQDEQTM